MTTHQLDEVLDAGQQDGEGCEAVIPFIGVNWPCPDPAVGRFRRACVHEHIRDGWLCREHAQRMDGLCRTCNDLGDGMAHECLIVLTPLEEGTS